MTDHPTPTTTDRVEASWPGTPGGLDLRDPAVLDFTAAQWAETMAQRADDESPAKSLNAAGSALDTAFHTLVSALMSAENAVYGHRHALGPTTLDAPGLDMLEAIGRALDHIQAASSTVGYAEQLITEGRDTAAVNEEEGR